VRRGVLWLAPAAGFLILASGPALAGTSSGNGAQKSGLSTPSSSGSGCQQGSGSSSNGWAILNKTGAPVPGTSVVQGEVHVVDSALAGQTVMAFVVPSGSSSCMSMNMTAITLNGQGIGNGHLSGMEANGNYFVAIEDMSGNEVLASQSVPLL